jgi:hypothetical protein
MKTIHKNILLGVLFQRFSFRQFQQRNMRKGKPPDAYHQEGETGRITIIVYTQPVKPLGFEHKNKTNQL